jgi:hypothetical protein
VQEVLDRVCEEQMSLTCEKLIHGHKAGRRTVAEDGTVTWVGASTHHPYKCGRPADRLEVHGDSYTAFATLCKIHKNSAIREGFKLEVLEKGIPE